MEPAEVETKRNSLKDIFSSTLLFPSLPDIKDHEIQLTSSYVGEGGQGTCKMGIFLGDQQVVMKMLKVGGKNAAKTKKVLLF